MNDAYSFLKDELALIEIHKHKWVESEKAGREIGFVTAALDWIKKYGDDWKRSRLNSLYGHSIFSEKRRYRRFLTRLPLLLKIQDSSILSCINDINLVGLSCSIPIFVPQNSPVEITLDLPGKNSPQSVSSVQFQSCILRIASEKKKNIPQRYCIVIPFAEHIRDYLRIYPDYFVSPA